MALSWIYGRIADLRNALYERGALVSQALGAPAISVGNITVGGTGKTPVVAFVAETLAARGARVCILTRGYGRENPRARALVADGESVLATARAAGDEPFELARRLSGRSLVIADADRVAAARWARAKYPIDVFVLDDAFQHRRARRDLDVVLLDATNPFGNGKTLPFGILREPLAHLRRADLLLLTRANLVEEAALSKLKARIAEHTDRAPIFTSSNRTARLTPLEDFHAGPADNSKASAESSTAGRALAFCALGNPDNFFRQLALEGFSVAAKTFPDHHRYTAADVARLHREAAASKAERFLTTAKDAVKLTDFRFELPCFVVENELRFDDETELKRTIGAVLDQRER